MKNLESHILYGIVTSLIIILASIILYITKYDINGGLRIITLFALILIGIYFSCKKYKLQLPNATNSEMFFNGFRTTAIIAIFVLGFAVLFLFINPSFKNSQIENFNLLQIKEAQNDAEKLKLVPQNVADYKSHFITLFIGSNMMLIIIAGLIGSAITSILNKKN